MLNLNMASTLQSFMHGGIRNLNRKKELWQVISKEKQYVEIIRTFPREDDVEGNFRSSLSFTKYINSQIKMDNIMDYILVHELSNGMYGLGVHATMYVPAIRSLGSPEQAEKWIGDQSSLSIIGSFVQTEIGHGSSVRDIETRVTYDEISGDLVVNTPSKRAVKWWPGVLGHLANCIILQAQLYIRGKCHGVHSFFLQIRDFNSHEPLEGIEVGPLPRRMTGNFGNSGYISFNNVHIPRENLLQKIATIDAAGNYQRSGHDRKSYLPMMIARIVIALQSVECIKKALIIAVRYNLIRRQGRYSSNEPEVHLIEHQTQQMRLMPSLALAFSMSAFAYQTLDAFSVIEDPVELHLLTCCVKGHISELATKACELARRTVGGNGFLVESQIGPLATLSLVANTVEGDNVLLYIQIGRLLLTFLNGQRQSRTVMFLHHEVVTANCFTPITSEKLLLLPQVLCKKMLQKVSEKLSRAVSSGQSLSEAVRSHTQEMAECAEVFCDFLLLDAFMKQLVKGEYKDQLLDHLQFAVSLYLVHLRANLYLQNGIISPDQSLLIKEALLSSFGHIRENASTIIDGFYIPDHLLSSVLLGNSEEEIYSNLLQSGRRTREETFKLNPRMISAKL